MIFSYILCAVITSMATIIAFISKANLQMQREIRAAHQEHFRLEEKLRLSQAECRSLAEDRAWKAGMEAGRKTDTLYKQIMKRYSGEQQFTVMMNGLEEDELK